MIFRSFDQIYKYFVFVQSDIDLWMNAQFLPLLFRCIHIGKVNRSQSGGSDLYAIMHNSRKTITRAASFYLKQNLFETQINNILYRCTTRASVSIIHRRYFEQLWNAYTLGCPKWNYCSTSNLSGKIMQTKFQHQLYSSVALHIWLNLTSKTQCKLNFWKDLF